MKFTDVKSQDSTISGFFVNGIFTSNLYLFDNNIDNTTSSINSIQKKVNAVKRGHPGFTCYGPIFGIFLSMLGYATKCKIGGKTFYADNKCFCRYLAGKIGSELIVPDEAIKQIQAQWKRFIEKSDKTLEINQVISALIPDAPELQKEVRKAVDAFLLPYITGQIESEDDKRLPFFTTLLREMKQKFGEEINEYSVQCLAIDAYLLRSAHGLYINQKSARGVFLPGGEEFTILVEAVKPALEKDFPQFSIGSKEIETLCSKALDKVNQERNADLNGIIDYMRRTCPPMDAFQNNWPMAKDPLKAYQACNFF